MNPNEIPPELLSESFLALDEALKFHIADLANRYPAAVLMAAFEARRATEERRAEGAREAADLKRAREGAVAAGAAPETVQAFPGCWGVRTWGARTPEGLPLVGRILRGAWVWITPTSTEDVCPGPELEHRVGCGEKWWGADEHHHSVTAWRVKS